MVSTAEVITRCPEWWEETQRSIADETELDDQGSPVGAKAGSDRGSADSATASTRGSDSEQQEKELKGGMLRADVAAFEPGMSAFGLTSARAREIAAAAAEAADRERWDRVLAELANGTFA